jgi:ribosome-binding factor A
MKNVGDGRRVVAVERQIQTTVANFLIRGFKLPLPGLVTVAAVKMPADLRAAKVHVSEMSEEDGADPEKLFQLNEKKTFKVLDIDTENRKIALSLKK